MSNAPLEPEILTPERLPSNFQPTARRFPWGCLLGGCLTVVLVMIGGMVALGLGTVWFYNRQVAQYTSEEARELPRVEVSAEELQELEKRIEAFQDKVKKEETPDQLILTADEINALISKQEALKDHVFIKIEDGLIKAEVSIPTDAIPGAQGRFFNGSASIDASLEDGVLIVTLQNAEANGQPVPEAIMAQMRKENLAKDIYKDPEVAKKLRRFESLVVEDNRIVLTPRIETEPKAPPTEAAVPQSSSPEEPTQEAR